MMFSFLLASVTVQGFSTRALLEDLQVDLGTAADFVILSKTGISNVYQSVIDGNIGSSPITGAAILLTCAEVSGEIYSVDADGPACSISDATKLTTAIGDMETAYTTVAGLSANETERKAGSIGGETFTAGVYSWSSGLLIASDLYLSGTPDDVFVFQIAQDLLLPSGVRITLQDGAQASNVFWQVAGQVTLETTSHFEGTILCASLIAMKTNADINGRLLAQTAVTLQMNTVVQVVRVAEASSSPTSSPTHTIECDKCCYLYPNAPMCGSPSDPSVYALCVAQFDSYCGDTEWDLQCREAAVQVCGMTCSSCQDPSEFCCVASEEVSCGLDHLMLPVVACVCAFDSWCCNNNWDDQCVLQAKNVCDLTCLA